MSISWGKRERYKFHKVGTLPDWKPPADSAVYAITYQADADKQPKSHTVLYFGEVADMAQEAPAINERVIESWRNTGGTPNDLFVFVHPMSGSTKQERLRLQQQLVIDYRPHCN